jgi:hypothetical protein
MALNKAKRITRGAGSHARRHAKNLKGGSKDPENQSRIEGRCFEKQPLRFKSRKEGDGPRKLLW